MSRPAPRANAHPDATFRLPAPARPRWAIPLLALALFLVTFAVNLQAPLVPHYAAASGAGTGAQALAFACYVGALVPTLLLLAGLSDRVGRRLPLAVALLLALAGTWLTLRWPTLVGLGGARACYGVATGLVAGSGTAFMTELYGDREDAATRGAALVAAATSLGFGTGALVTGICLVVAPSMLPPVSLWAYPPLAFVAAFAVAALPAPARHPNVPWLRWPVLAPGTVPLGVAILLAWAAVGVVIGVVPAALAAHGHAAWAGFATFFVISTGLLFQPAARRMAPVKAVRIGLVLVPLGFVVLALGVTYANLPALLVGAAVASSACYGFTYLGGLAAVNAAVAPALRARAAAGYFLFAYFGFSVPVVTSGWLADHFGMPVALSLFTAALIAGSVALAVTLRRETTSVTRPV
ncbi:MFS transporter [Pandoraea fibrosis]|uniref:MFS transporter n=1 Tax=Pandoraea fibrosis TaxID=1891094 RepID=A0ABX6HKD2_9BURK|nr:MFS transporter [Pandoraea fibrosis]QHE90483.1 MFS transporter [Pandoraea fibrosis]QHF11315.1 MFS transporter [Pandoraea fibrosis]